MNNKTTWTWIIILVLFVGFVVWLIKTPGREVSSKYDAFATCINDSGAKFYGAFWCPHCAAQKALFGSAVKLLPYVECSLPDGQTQNEVCNSVGIKSYPTWVFRTSATTTATSTGEQSLETLAKATSCVLPQ